MSTISVSDAEYIIKIRFLSKKDLGHILDSVNISLVFMM